MSKNFTLGELCATSYPALQKSPTQQQLANLAYLCAAVLQPLRDALGSAVILSSGFRSVALNNHVGGVKNSYHITGFAADIRIFSDAHARQMFRLLQKIPAVDSCLFERKGSTKWLHVQTSYYPRGLFNFNYVV